MPDRESVTSIVRPECATAGTIATIDGSVSSSIARRRFLMASPQSGFPSTSREGLSRALVRIDRTFARLKPSRDVVVNIA